MIGAEQRARSRAGERIHTEDPYRYDPEEFESCRTRRDFPPSGFGAIGTLILSVLCFLVSVAGSANT